MVKLTKLGKYNIMSKSNIIEVTNLRDLKTVMMSHVTVVLGLTVPSVHSSLKCMIRKFLKRKSESIILALGYIISFVIKAFQESRQAL